ncbi:PAS domain-containing protein [Luteithermobacter gelatinilyticus]|uniref:PAS domain-containing protein n=1 Tax=Luteithermobacter gelatinilyticus TaxID=2582913 RepID=UPI001AEFF4F0|nr:PAS domain-containing protein [Luteithermobacter gelatinilyticus]
MIHANSPDTLVTDLSKGDFSENFQKDVLAYWNLIRGSRQMPSRKDFDPVKVPTALGNLLLVDVVANPVKFRIRLLGTGLTPLFEGDRTGYFIDEIPYSGQIIQRFQWLISHKKPYYIRSDFSWPGEDPKPYTSLALPLSEDGQTVTMILCCIHLLQLDPGGKMFWFRHFGGGAS